MHSLLTGVVAKNLPYALDANGRPVLTQVLAEREARELKQLNTALQKIQKEIEAYRKKCETLERELSI